MSISMWFSSYLYVPAIVKIEFTAPTVNLVKGVSSLCRWRMTWKHMPPSPASPGGPRGWGSLTEERGQPVDVDLAVGVQERKDLASGHGRPQESGPDQPFPFLGANNPHFGKPSHVFFQLLLQVFWEGGRRTGTERTQHISCSRITPGRLCVESVNGEAQLKPIFSSFHRKGKD